MSIPSVQITVLSGGLGATAASPSNVICVFGCSSGGTDFEIAGPYASPKAVVAANGYGPGSELVAYLAAAGVTALYCKLPNSTPGASGSVTHSGTGAATLTPSGTPNDKYDVVVTLTRDGTAGSDPEPGFTLSYDGGLTTSGEIRIPSSRAYADPISGLTLTFSAASCVAGDTYVFSTSAPEWTVSDLQTGLTALKTSSTKAAALAYVVGPAAASDVSTALTTIDSFVTARKFIRCLFETRDIDVGGGETEDEWMDAIEADFVTTATDRVGVCAAPAIVPSAVTGINFRRNGWPAIRRAGLVPVGRDLGRVKDGALPGVTTVFHDEYSTPGLDADRFITFMSIPGEIGFFVTNPNLMSGPGSDFSLLQYGRVMDEACRIAYAFFRKELSNDVRLERTGERAGLILEKDARSLELGCDAALEAGLVATNDVSGVSTVVSRLDNISSTKTLTATINILPKGYIKTISLTLQMVNPAIQIAA